MGADGRLAGAGGLMLRSQLVVWKCLKAIARPLAIVLFDLKVYGRMNVPRAGGALIVSNHQGNLDPVLLGVALDRPLSYIAKSELFENPYFAWFLRLLNAFPVRQGGSDLGAMREMIQRLREGQVLNIFPEGARSEDGEIAELQKGVAAVVRRCDVPVVPAVIVGSYEAWPVHQRFPRCWPIRVRYGPPLHLRGLSADEIVATLDRTLREMFDELRARGGCPDASDGDGHSGSARGAAQRPRTLAGRVTSF